MLRLTEDQWWARLLDSDRENISGKIDFFWEKPDSLLIMSGKICPQHTIDTLWLLFLCLDSKCLNKYISDLCRCLDRWPTLFPSKPHCGLCHDQKIQMSWEEKHFSSAMHILFLWLSGIFSHYVKNSWTFEEGNFHKRGLWDDESALHSGYKDW